MYLVKASPIFKKLYPRNLLWAGNATNIIHLTFDDGPHPTATPFVLDELKKYGAKATFFCIGDNVIKYPEIYSRIITEGHSIGNHTQHHLNGWQVDTETYLADIDAAASHIDSKLFRPPYGRIKRKQAKRLTELGYNIVLWDVLSGDFDQKISPEKCWQNVAANIEGGSIIVFHDSSKSWDRMHFTLPRTLALCTERGWQMESLR